MLRLLLYVPQHAVQVIHRRTEAFAKVCYVCVLVAGDDGQCVGQIAEHDI